MNVAMPILEQLFTKAFSFFSVSARKFSQTIKNLRFKNRTKFISRWN